MISVKLNDTSFQYDVHSLVKAFYPAEEVHILTEENETGEAFSGFKVRYLGISLSAEFYEKGQIMKREMVSTEGLERAMVKNVLKKTLYRLLNKITGINLPWGTLTGIRPTKIPMKLLQEGKSESEIKTYMEDTYYTSSEKISLATQIAKRENGIISKITKEKGYSLYVGIPFCPTTCLYCSFTSYPIERFANLVDQYLDCLEEEIKLTAELYRDNTLYSVYIGGGTPTTLKPQQLRRLIGILKQNFDFKNVLEFTVEAGRPDSITEDKLLTLKELGVSRISINPQTMNDETLRVIGRRHSVSQVKDAYALARKVGFDNINMDIILGLPGEDESMVAHTLSEIKTLGPDSLTVHSMAIKRAAGMHQYLLEHQEIKSQNTPEMMDMTMHAASEMGLMPYYLYRQKNMAGNFENVGYAKEGKEGIYNILIMEEVHDIAACGAGVISKVVFDDGRIERNDNVKDVTLYVREHEKILQKKKHFYDIMFSDYGMKE